MANDEERKFRLRPRKPSARSERRVLATAYKIIMHYARMSGVRKHRTSGGSKRTRPYFQRCAVRVSYSKNATAGHWRAHGRYLVRESVTFDGGSRGIGFDGKCESTEIVQRLESWQQAGDERLWKIIVSPEFGDRVDLKKLTRDLLAGMEKNLGTPLEWAAVAHFNTEHPHVHVALRGVGAEGGPIRLGRDYVREGIREMAQDLCTRQLGYRSQWDAAEAQRREVQQHRYTSLDRAIQRDGTQTPDSATPFLTVALDPSQGNSNSRLLKQHMTERLLVLKTMGLAEHAGPNLWRVRGEFEDVLRAMQRSGDRQKTLAAHGALMSDERLPLEVLDLRNLTTLEGRILVHGEEESSGRSYLMLEGTDARVHHVYYTPEMEAARNRGGLRTNSFVRLRKLFTDGHPALEIDDVGDSEAILRNERHLRDTVQRLIRRGIVPREDGWNGWLGRYQKALKEAAMTLEQQRLAKEVERHKRRDLGR
jgi:type IV secretory pathway VirD2 relaxase/predicted DNA-binding transcriptional regulator